MRKKGLHKTTFGALSSLKEIDAICAMKDPLLSLRWNPHMKSILGFVLDEQGRTSLESSFTPLDGGPAVHVSAFPTVVDEILSG